MLNAFLYLAKSEYQRWIKSDKQLITAFSLIFYYIYVIKPLTEYSAILNEPTNILEAFIIILSNGYTIPVLIITFMVLMIDNPNINRNSLFVMLRTGRTKWYINQLIFVITAILSFVLLLLLFSSLLIVKNSFIANGWSIAVNDIHLEVFNEIKRKYPLAILDLSIINNFTPYKAVILSIVFIFLYLLFTVQIQMCFTLKFNKIIGMAVNLSILSGGLVLWITNSPLKWIFPMANSTIGWHYNELFNKTEFPIILSLVYLIIINVIAFITGKNIIKNKNITLLSQE